MNTEQIVKISIARGFSKYPAGRYEADGDHNGTKFRKKHLLPHLQGDKVLEVSFDGVAGLGSSFLEEAFGGLVRDEGMNKEFLDEHLRLSAHEDDLKDFVELARKYIADADRIAKSK